MQANIQNMTIREIEKYVADLETRIRDYVVISNKYFELMDSVEKFSNELEEWEKFYNEQYDRAFKNWIPGNETSSNAYREASGECCAMRIIKREFARFLTVD